MKWHAPVDPDCPEVSEYTETLMDDPMSAGAPVGEILEDFERKHQANCEHCKEYGATNIEVI